MVGHSINHFMVPLHRVKLGFSLKGLSVLGQGSLVKAVAIT